MATIMNVKDIEVEAQDTRVSVTFSCGSEEDAETLCDIIVDGVTAGSVKIGKFSFSGSPVTDCSDNQGDN